MGWFDTVLSVATTAGRIAAKVLPLLLVEDQKSQGALDTQPIPDYNVGPVTWALSSNHAEDGHILAQNHGEIECGISFAKSEGRTSLSVYQPIEPGKEYDASQDLSNFISGGTIVCATQADPAATGVDASGVSPGKVLMYAMSFINLDVDFYIGTYLTCRLTTDDAGKVVLKIGGNYSLLGWTVSCSLKDFNNNESRIERTIERQTSELNTNQSQTTSASSNYNFAVLPLGKGVVAQPMAQYISMRIVMTNDAYQHFTSERRSRLRPISTKKVLQKV